jgi:hypothetical protein
VKKITVAISNVDKKKFEGTLGGMLFIGEYSFGTGVHSKTISVSVTLTFPHLNTQEEDYTIISADFDESEYGGRDNTIEEARDLIIVTFKELGVKGVWK